LSLICLKYKCKLGIKNIYTPVITLNLFNLDNDFSVGEDRRRHRMSEFIIADYTPRAIPKESPFNVTPSGSITTSRLTDASTLPAITAVN
jgi:hypothetical protein